MQQLMNLTICSIPNYIMGSGERLEITVDIKNTGEDAFNTIFYFQVHFNFILNG